ncbi:ATPase family associated with various cellular activities (AAA) [Ruegeria intermedia]|uniref:ATPase family associated with various cellular activities (AAA) n=1 Tax=Ruegeria intermedia TaxID=996115 RepID=A0A1M4Y933_9RHOB|nr:AAA family ATPase [Ruegeria intermedia]SHF02261.1 ATPase family associated with various cellular activities (AAA) [Ruegeria intermedia]
MTRSTTTIPFHDLTFVDDIPKLRDVDARLQKFLRTIRRQKQDEGHAAGKISEDDLVSSYELIMDSDRARIKRRAMRYVERLSSSTGMSHLSEENRAKLTPLRGGLPVTRVTSEHEADEIAAALHAEMPWMAPATEAVWHGLRASAREDLPGVRFTPLVLNGPPGIGKSFWARRLAHHLEVPATKIDATGEPASFALTGSQRGWGSAHAGKLVNTVLNSRHGGPLVIIDEIEKADEVQSNKGTRHTLTDALLPLLERMTAATWECPFFQVKMDMSWVNWVMTANSRQGLPEPFQSRCVVLDLPDLTTGQLRDFAMNEAARRGLPEPATDALAAIFETDALSNRRLSLRTVARMLDRAEALAKHPVLH